LITRRDEPVRLKLLRGTVRRTTACPPAGPQLGWRSSPRSKRMTRPCASRTLLSSCLRGQCRLTLWGNPGRPGRADVAPAQAFFVDRSYVPCAGQRLLLRRPLAVRSRLGPQRRRASLAGFKEVSYYHRVTALRGLSNRATKDTPVRWRGLPSATVANVWGVGAFRRRGDRWFPESGPVLTTGAVPWGLWIRFSHA